MSAAPLSDAEILRRLSKADRPLPSPGAVALELMRALERRDMGMRDIAQIARKDPALVARMIQLANSAIFVGLRPAVAIEEAVLRIGTGGLARLAIAMSLMQRNKLALADGFDPHRFWMTSIQRGLVFQHLSQRVGKMPSAEAFSLGLLADIGLFAMAATLGRDAFPGDAQDGPIEHLLDAQRQRFGFDQTDASAALLAHWGFPFLLAQAVRMQPMDAEAAKTREAQLAQCVVLSRSLQLRPDGTASDASARRRLAEHLQLTEADLQSVLASAAQDMVGMAAVFDMRLVQQDVDAEFDRLRRALTSPPVLSDPVAEHVLVVSSDAELRSGLRHVLRTAGHAVVEAEGLTTAAEMMQTYGPRVVVLDWDASGGDVPTLCRTLSAECGPRLYLLALSRCFDQQCILSALDAGANDVLSAPVLPQMLVSKVQTGARATRVLAAAEAERSQSLSMQRTLEQRNAELLQVAGTDELTGLANRRALDAFLQAAFAQALEEGQPLACIMFDLDEFKIINDRLGHDVGDLALRAVAQVLRQQSRGMDFMARVGGEEFLMLCPQTDQAAAVCVAERIRMSITALEGDLPPITVSAGVAVGPTAGQDEASLLRAADQALLQAKRLGRNQVCVAPASATATG